MANPKHILARSPVVDDRIIKTPFTPAPWLVAQDSESILATFRYGEDDPEVIAMLDGDWMSVEYETERHANARLISQAPMMCDVLTDCLAVLNMRVQGAELTDFERKTRTKISLALSFVFGEVFAGSASDAELCRKALVEVEQ